MNTIQLSTGELLGQATGIIEHTLATGGFSEPYLQARAEEYLSDYKAYAGTKTMPMEDSPPLDDNQELAPNFGN